jgi:hypothetical protein
MAGSLNMVVQLLGRAMRPKGDGYPSAHRDRARLVFFVPCGGGSALARLPLDHSRHALLTCCFLADHEVGQEWIVLREVRRGIEDARGPRDENPAAADADIEANEPLDPEIRAQVELAMASARNQIISEGGEPTVGEILQLAAERRPDLPDAALYRVAAEILAAQPDSTGNKAREAIHREITKSLRIDPQVKKAMEDAFAVVLIEFRDATLRDSIVLRSVGRQVHSITGGQIQKFANRLREAVALRNPRAEALRKTRELCELLALGAEIPKELVTWRNNVKQLKQRHLRGEEVVGNYLEMETEASKRGLPDLFDITTDEERRRKALDKVAAMCKRVSERGECPTKNSSDEHDRRDATLISAIRRAKQGRGKHFYLLEMERIAERHGLPGLFDDQRARMLSQTRTFCRRYRNSRLPTSMPNDPNRKDGQWLAAKRRVKVGEATGIWYPEMDEIAREEGFHGLFDREVITRERALDWLSRYYQKHGKYPDTRTGRVEEAVDDGYAYREISWQALHRRFPLQELIGVSRPPFAPDLVAKWNDQELTSGRPAISKMGTSIVESARADGYPISGSAINSLLRRDHGTSLAELLRPSNRTEFTIAMAERWLKEEYLATGSWPSVVSDQIRSAQVDGYIGLSGNALNKLLRRAGTTLSELKKRLSEKPPSVTCDARSM